MIIFFVIFITVLALILQRYYSLRGLDGLEESHRTSVNLAEPGEVFHIILTFTNRSRMFIPFIRFREYMTDGISAADGSENIYEDLKNSQYIEGTTWLKPHQKLEKHIPVKADNRGRYLLRELAVYGGDFLGLSEHMRSYGRINEIVIYPKEAPDTEIDKVFGGFLGELSVNRFIFEDPVLTLGYRDYTGRDPMKMISWSQSARSNSLMVKKFDYTLEPSVSVIVNVETVLENSEELLEKCYSIARTVCRKLEDKGIKYDFRMNCAQIGALNLTCYINEGMGKRHFQAILESLGRAGHNAVYSCETLVERTVRSSGTGHGIIFITPGGDARLESKAKLHAKLSGSSLLILTAGGDIQ